MQRTESIETTGHTEHAERIQRIRAELRFRRHEVHSHYRDRDLKLAVDGRDLVRVVQGAYIAEQRWREFRGEARLAARTIAIAHLHKPRPTVFSHESAAALWGLPLYRLDSLRTHALTNPDRPSRSSKSLLRHPHEIRGEEIAELAGVHVTSLGRTVRDLGRSADAELALACADAAARRIFETGQAADGSGWDAVNEWRADELELLARQGAVPGAAQAREILRFADPRADSVLESVSRLYLKQLKLPFRIHVPVIGRNGANYRVDFELLGHAETTHVETMYDALTESVFCEVDGRVKYTDEGILAGRSISEALIAEKEREDDIRGVTGKRVIRWGAKHLESVDTLAARLVNFGIPIPKYQ